MNFWQEKMAELRPAQPQRPAQSAAWWQPRTVPQPRQDGPGQPPSAGPGDYAPATSQRLSASEEVCPRCGSEDYIEVAMDLTYGGRGGLAETGFNLGKNKRCFSCRYPSFNPSGEVVRGKASPVQGAKAKTQQVRQAGGSLYGSWGDGSWDNAPLIA